MKRYIDHITQWIASLGFQGSIVDRQFVPTSNDIMMFSTSASIANPSKYVKPKRFAIEKLDKSSHKALFCKIRVVRRV